MYCTITPRFLRYTLFTLFYKEYFIIRVSSVFLRILDYTVQFLKIFLTIFYRVCNDKTHPDQLKRHICYNAPLYPYCTSSITFF